MVNPILSVRLAIQSGFLNIHILISGVKVDVANSRSLACDRALDADTLEIRWNNEVDILTRVWEKAHHGKGNKATHGATIVVAGQTIWRRGEEAGDVEVAAFGG